MPPPNKTGSCLHIGLADYQDWFEAILMDDSSMIKEILSTTRGENLLEAHFELGDAVMRRQVSAGPCSSVQLPLAVAAVSGASQSIKALLQAGVSPNQVDCHGNNVVHSMIAYLHYHSDMEDAVVSKFQLLVDTVSVDVMREILHHENSFGLRPIEFAAQHGQGSMVLAIMNTPGVYLTKQQVVGLTCYKWYNITEYESTGSGYRSHKSPLLLMTYIDRDISTSDGFASFMNSSIIQHWFSKKFWMNLPMIVLWCVLRMILVIMYTFVSLDMGSVDENDLNGTQCIPEYSVKLSMSNRTGIITLLVIMAGFSVLCDLVSVLYRLLSPSAKPVFNMMSRRKRLLAQVTFYRLCTFALCGCILLSAPSTYGLGGYFAEGLVDYTNIMAPFVATWSLMYFVQLVPSIGFAVSSIYAMIKNLFVFAVIYVMMVMPFVQAFYTFMNNNTLQGCIPGFADLFESFYTMFLVMLSIITPSDYDMDKRGLLYLTHIVYTFGISILLINYIIAVMSDTMANLTANRVVMDYIQKANVAYSVENYTRRLFKPYYSYMTNKYFLVDNNRILLIDAKPVVQSEVIRTPCTEVLTLSDYE